MDTVKPKALVAQSCPTLCDLMDWGLPRLLCPRDSPGKNTGVGCHSLLQGIFPTQGLNLGLLRCSRILYQVSQQDIFKQKIKFFMLEKTLDTGTIHGPLIPSTSPEKHWHFNGTWTSHYTIKVQFS